jgi:replication-associated recombination protein RarA
VVGYSSDEEVHDFGMDSRHETQQSRSEITERQQQKEGKRMATQTTIPIDSANQSTNKQQVVPIKVGFFGSQGSGKTTSAALLSRHSPKRFTTVGSRIRHRHRTWMAVLEAAIFAMRESRCTSAPSLVSRP